METGITGVVTPGTGTVDGTPSPAVKHVVTTGEELDSGDKHSLCNGSLNLFSEPLHHRIKYEIWI